MDMLPKLPMFCRWWHGWHTHTPGPRARRQIYDTAGPKLLRIVSCEIHQWPQRSRLSVIASNQDICEAYDPETVPYTCCFALTIITKIVGSAARTPTRNDFWNYKVDLGYLVSDVLDCNGLGFLLSPARRSRVPYLSIEPATD